MVKAEHGEEEEDSKETEEAKDTKEAKEWEGRRFSTGGRPLAQSQEPNPLHTPGLLSTPRHPRAP